MKTTPVSTPQGITVLAVILAARTATVSVTDFIADFRGRPEDVARE
ncbi:MAG: hypothetical protein IH986_16610 [Planctomycetes bacterium]|nr:hypothetical protein [Planctomycetota bacterium]